jgi:prepilin peptidase CpaA
MALLGGALALCNILFKGGAFKRLSYYYQWMFARFKGLKVPLAISKDSMKTTYPYGVAIAGGAILSFVGKAWIT